MSIRSFALTLACLLMVSQAHAATRMEDAVPQQTPTVTSGGVGDEAEARLDQIQNHYSLKLVFVGQGGIYLDAINVTIDDKYQNRIINTTTDGPILLADLTPGRYKVTAELEGHTVSQNVVVNKSGLRSYTLRFPIGE